MTSTVRRFVAQLVLPALCLFGAAGIGLPRGLPPIAVAASEVRLGLGSSRSVSLSGSELSHASVNVDDPAIVSAVLKGAELELRAKAVGRALVTISSGIDNATLAVQVKPWAAVFPQTLHVDVSGTPALASTVQGAVSGALKTQFVTAQSGNSQFVLPPITEIGAGTSRTIDVNAHVKAPDALPAAGDVKVVIRNLGLPHQPDEALWYSNDPESVDRPGPLFSSTLSQGEAVRLLYHHLNASEVAMYFRVQAINDTDSTASLLVIPGDAQPDKNPVKAGLQAADAYLRAGRFDSGEVVSIPPHSTIPVSLRQVFVGETMSGLCGLRLVSGPKTMQIRMDAWPQFPVDARWTAALYSPTPWREVGANPVNDYDTAPYEPSEHVYPDPYRDISLSYEVGGRFGEFRLGQRPIASQDDQHRLDGNFGVLYRIQASISNPTKAPTDVELMFEASAGYAAGLFLVDGDLITTPLLQPKQQACVGRFHLEPGARQTLRLTTLPLSGGSYPATLILRPVPPPARPGPKHGT